MYHKQYKMPQKKRTLYLQQKPLSPKFIKLAITSNVQYKLITDTAKKNTSKPTGLVARFMERTIDVLKTRNLNPKQMYWGLRER